MSGDILIYYLLLTANIVAIGILLYLLPRAWKASRAAKEASTIIRDIISELRGRLAQQDERVIDQQVHLDILEIEIKRLMAGASPKEAGSALVPPTRTSPPSPDVVLKAPMLHRELRAPQRHITPSHPEGLGGTEMAILGLLADGAKKSSEMQSAIGRSREHTARMLKKLFDGGYVRRGGAVKPYLYELTERGRLVLG